ncbi:MAG TPA: LamG domain-containing protein, partial [Phycisphaerales bacterium]|nr:LamG domain-containing protein [Phycisphaerales bacterium]
PPRYVAGMLPPWPEDLVQDGTVNLRDVEALVADWLEDDYYVTTSAPTGGQVAYYPFNGNANDASGNAHHGTANGAVTYGTGVYGQAAHLNGADAYISVGAVGISGAAARTIAGWARADTLTITNWTNLFGFTNSLTEGQGNRSFDIEKLGNWNFGYGIHVYGWERPIMPLDLDWHHLAATYDGTTIAWYGDGRAVGSEARALDTVDNVQMGKRGDNTAYFPGSIDDVYIYNTALTQAQICYLAGAGAPQWYAPVLSPANISDAEPQGDKVVNFKDLALILARWLQTQVWPAP